MRVQRPQGHRARAGVTLITSADVNLAEEHRYRMLRYAATMTLRLVCLLVAVLTRGTVVMWIAAVGAVLLPWMAVLMANDRLPKAHRDVAWHDGRHDTGPAIGSTIRGQIIDHDGRSDAERETERG